LRPKCDLSANSSTREHYHSTSIFEDANFENLFELENKEGRKKKAEVRTQKGREKKAEIQTKKRLLLFVVPIDIERCKKRLLKFCLCARY
jgi:hypothetical protein